MKFFVFIADIHVLSYFNLMCVETEMRIEVEHTLIIFSFRFPVRV
jgi:hypothetical protein